MQKSSRNAMADCSRLAGDAAAGDGADDIELLGNSAEIKRLADDQLQGLETEVIVDIAAVDGDSAGALIEADSGDRVLFAAGAVKVRIL